MRGQPKNKQEFRQLLIPNSAKIHKAKDPTLTAAILAIGDQATLPVPPTLLERIAHFYAKRIGVVRPNNFILLCWDVVIIVTVIFYIMEIGFLMGFGEIFWQDELNTIIPLHIIITVFLCFDVLLAPCKAFYQDGLLITDSVVILRHYLRFEGPLDLLTIISIIIPLASRSLPDNWIKIIWVFKFYTVSRINDEFERVTQLYISWSTTYLVIKLSVIGILYAHFMGIFFYLVSLWVYTNNYYGPNTPNLCWIYNGWAFDQMVIILSWPQMYVYIMYFSIGVVTTIAYGDITPKNPIECLYMILILIMITLILGYLMTEILRLLVNVFSYNFERKLRHVELLQKMEYEKVKRETQAQIRAHTQEIDREEQFRNRKVQEEVLSFLPNQPLFALLVTVYKDFLKDLSLDWSQQLGENPLRGIKILHNHSLFLQNFVKDIKERRHYPGDVFYKEGERSKIRSGGHCAYYFTKQQHLGNVRLGLGSLPKIEARMRRGENTKDKCYNLAAAPRSFGVVGMLTGQERTHWAVCTANCVVFVAQRESIFRHYPLLTLEQREKLQMRVQEAQEECLICQKDHPSMRCPFTFYTPTDLIHQDIKALRKHRLLVSARTRLKTLSSWTIFSKIRNQRVQISRQYKDRLLIDRGNHGLFMRYQLQQDDAFEEEEPFQTRLFEAEVMVEQVYGETREEMSACSMEFEFDQVRNYRIYRPHNNIEEIKRDYNTRERRVAGINHLIRANLLRIIM